MGREGERKGNVENVWGWCVGNFRKYRVDGFNFLSGKEGYIEFFGGGGRRLGWEGKLDNFLGVIEGYRIGYLGE